MLRFGNGCIQFLLLEFVGLDGRVLLKLDQPVARFRQRFGAPGNGVVDHELTLVGECGGARKVHRFDAQCSAERCGHSGQHDAVGVRPPLVAANKQIGGHIRFRVEHPHQPVLGGVELARNPVRPHLVWIEDGA